MHQFGVQTASQPTLTQRTDPARPVQPQPTNQGLFHGHRNLRKPGQVLSVSWRQASAAAQAVVQAALADRLELPQQQASEFQEHSEPVRAGGHGGPPKRQPLQKNITLYLLDAGEVSQLRHLHSRSAHLEAQSGQTRSGNQEYTIFSQLGHLAPAEVELNPIIVLKKINELR